MAYDPNDPLYKMLQDEDIKAFNAARQAGKTVDLQGALFRGIDLRNMNADGLNMQDVQDAVETALSGRVTGLVYLGDQRFDLVIRLKDKERKDKNVLSNILVGSSLYPLKYSLNALITLFGVSNNPSLLGSSPIQVKIVLNASSASLSEIPLETKSLLSVSFTNFIAVFYTVITSF